MIKLLKKNTQPRYRSAQQLNLLGITFGPAILEKLKESLLLILHGRADATVAAVAAADAAASARLLC
jgi:hypothetical protein